MLFTARCVMGVQFESVGALGPLLRAEGLDYARLGILVGAYLAPSVLVALPGGMAIQKLGERTTLLLCAALMVAGAAVDLSSDWNARLLARIIAGAGGVVFTVAGTKMITDMFAGRQLGLAMAALAGSWPCGIALALISLPPIADKFGLIGASVALVILTLTTLILLFALPKQTRLGAPLSAAFPSAAITAAVVLAGLLVGTANATFANAFAFGPLLLTERGYTAEIAASHVSVALWVTIASIPVGGALAVRRGTCIWIAAAALLLAALGMAAVPVSDHDVLIFAGLGLVSGLSGASFVSLPSWVLPVQTRAVGMGIYFSAFYGSMLALPPIAGFFAHRAGGAGIAFDVAAVALLIVMPLLGGYAALVSAPRSAAAVEEGAA
ncbi:MFS transporter [Bradyrhizobium sp. WYCCWR 13023]|uniref:MFS transporter n=1 Tax=Bradyrhizobium zhengyangense TaxID=2911009 RepID=A0A9X1RJ66_9BRAD|nr:MFS transporter [Bradyrhizobium zhengyangense]MCG2632343.1 MFS transporter [Bradyrhizobium zhengyangense]